jgi:ribosome-binding protein aMBF1 (putative translation factor)
VKAEDLRRVRPELCGRALDGDEVAAERGPSALVAGDCRCGAVGRAVGAARARHRRAEARSRRERAALAEARDRAKEASELTRDAASAPRSTRAPSSIASSRSKGSVRR